MTPPISITFPVETLTPVWTGDVNKKTSYLRATSFMGGLRFWAEAMLRSLGHGDICDITNANNRCPQQPGEAQIICPACLLFGCTGRARSFGMKVVVGEQLTKKTLGPIKLHERQYTRNGNPKTPWYIDNKRGLEGNFTLQLSPLRPENIAQEVSAALFIQLNWGSLGARDQYGYGFVRCNSPFEENKMNTIAEEVVSTLQINAVGTGNQADLKDFFYFRSTAQQENDINPGINLNYQKIPFIIRHDTRNQLRGRGISQNLRHFFHGDVDRRTRNKQGTRFNIGKCNDHTLLGWGWFPRHGDYAGQRDICLNALKNEVTVHSTTGSVQWKEFNSSRDTCGSPTNWPDFLKQLITTSWR